jgi:hypothetical protein
VVLTGHFTTYDGGVYRLDPDGDTLVEVLSGEEHQAVFAAFASTPDISVLLTANVDNQYDAWCLHRGEHTLRRGWQTRQFLSDVVVSSDSDVFIGVSAGWPPSGQPTGVVSFDPVLCTPSTDEPIATSLDPHSLAIY